ncbi:protein CutA homolog isoform X2 [Muntiacus reevesi]|uniref:protein CutA homolog isoform X2 n=1 Tax=Muntiacus reevesi TaxID=9886 RepID=UPI003306B4F6
MSSSFPAPCSLSFRPAWLGPGRQWGGQQVGRGEGAQAFKPTRPPAARPQAAVPMACAGLVTSDAMDRLGSRCPLPGCARPSLLICLLILTASLLTYPVLRTLSLQLLSVVTGSYVSGTYSIVFVNCPNEQIARDIARAILDKKLAASVNILPRASSLYYWNGEIEEATEVLLLIKTKTSKIHVLSSYIRSVHPFEIPELFSLPMDQGDAHYLRWLEEALEE